MFDQASHGGQVFDFQARMAHRQVARELVDVLAHAGRRRQVDQFAAGQVGHPDLALVGEWMVAPADEIEGIAAQGTGMEFGQVRPWRGQRQVDLALPEHVQALVRESVEQAHDDARVFAPVFRDHGGQTIRRQRGQHRQGHPALAPRDEVAHVGKGGVQVGEQSARYFHEQLAFGCQRHVARVALDQFRASGRFQFLDHRAEGRLRQVAALGGMGEMAAFVQRQKGLQLFGGDVGQHR